MPNSISLKVEGTKKQRKSTMEISEELLHQLPKSIDHFFPKFQSSLRQVKDYREGISYSLPEILMCGISMYTLREGSRNALNNDRTNPNFRRNYEKLFWGMKLPHMDTVDDVFRQIEPEELEAVKVKMIRSLTEKKVLHNYRLLGKYFIVAIDATGVMSFNEKHCDKCLRKTSKNGKTSWFHNVLEAKLVTPTGLSISLATEWVENAARGYDKQDCERKAFERLAKKLKRYFPRLPICILGDGLYPNKKFFKICRSNNWEYILVLKDGNLPTLWKEVKLLLPLNKENREKVTRIGKGKEITTEYRWINDIDHGGYIQNWIKSKETIKSKDEEETKVFVHISSIKITKKTSVAISFTGRLRWKIENEGFNEQKNNGYSLEHKYSEVSLTASKNYYQSLQIASIINQLLEQGQKLKRYIGQKITIRNIWKNLLALLLYGEVDEEKIIDLLNRRMQIRLE